MLKTKGVALGAGLIALLMGGCKLDPKTRKIQYMPDMADGPHVKVQQDYLDPPDHAISRQYFHYSMENADSLPNPTDPENKETHESAKALYNDYCSICHGPDGKGSVNLTDKYPKAIIPNIVRQELHSRSDGWFFNKISLGGAQMPKYSKSTSRTERWLIVNHLRVLQSQSK